MVGISTGVETAVATMVAWLWKEYGRAAVDKTVGRVADETKWQWELTNYYYSLFERVGFVRILGRREAEPLENVFTHVNVLDRELAERRYDVARLQAEFAPRDFKWQERVTRLPGEQAVAEYDKLFILGKPGAGKTTFLKHTALRAIEGEIDKVPVFVSLKELSDRETGIVEFVVQQFGVHQVEGSEQLVKGLLRDGKALMLLDGLDEVNVGGEKRSRLIDMLNDFVYQYSECPMLLTCRVAAMDYSFTQFEYVEMADFDREQMGYYIDHWFVGDEVKRANCRKALLQTPDNEPIRELAQVPLLLGLLCLVFEERNEFPRQRHEIYEEAVRALLSKWDAERNIKRDTVYGQLSARRKEQMLAHLAATTFEEAAYFLREQRVVDLIEGYLKGVPGLEGEDELPVDGRQVLGVMEAQHGILVERARSIHSFSHLTLQEYFTAHYIVMNERRGTVKRLMAHIGDDRWDEVFVLTAGMLGDATEFVTLYLDQLEAKISGMEEVVALLKWVEAMRQEMPEVYQPAATRAFLLSHSNVLRLPLGLATRLENRQARADAKDLARTLDHRIDLALDLDVALDHPDDFERNLELVTRLAPEGGNARFEREVAELDVVTADAISLARLIISFREYWDPKLRLGLQKRIRKGAPTLLEEHAKPIRDYLKGARLLALCLDVAYLENREEVEWRILAPPKLEGEEEEYIELG